MWPLINHEQNIFIGVKIHSINLTVSILWLYNPHHTSFCKINLNLNAFIDKKSVYLLFCWSM